MSASKGEAAGSGWVLVAAILGTMVTSVDAAVVPVALPRIGRELPPALLPALGTLEGQAYVFHAYLLALNALLILAGALGDYFGRRRVFALGLAGFGVATLLSALAPALEVLVLCRALQGAAAALVAPGSLALIRVAFTGPAQARATGTWAAATAWPAILVPFAAGVLVDAISWRAGFLLNLPVIALALWVLWRHVPESRDPRASGRFHWTGAAVVAVAVGGLAFGPIYGQQREWRDPLAAAVLAVGVVAALALPLVMARAAHPLVPLDLFRSRAFAAANLSTLLTYGSLGMTYTYLALYLQGAAGYSAAATGLALMPGPLLIAFFAGHAGALAARTGPRPLTVAGPLVLALGALWLARFPTESAPWRLAVGDPATYAPPAGYLVDAVPGLLLLGVGAVLFVAPLATAAMAAAPEGRAGIASAVNNAATSLGPQLAAAAVFVAITAAFYGSLAGRAPELPTSDPAVRRQVSPLNAPEVELPPSQAAAARAASTDAFHLAMAAGAALWVAAAAVNAFGLGGPGGKGGAAGTGGARPGRLAPRPGE